VGRRGIIVPVSLKLMMMLMLMLMLLLLLLLHHCHYSHNHCTIIRVHIPTVCSRSHCNNIYLFTNPLGGFGDHSYGWQVVSLGPL